MDDNYFKILKKNCMYAGEGASFHGSCDWKDICKHKKNTPPGHSWGDCNKRVCPLVKDQNNDN